MEIVEITQLQAACQQLDRAMILVLEEKDYVSAVTLACATESMIGEYLRECGTEGMTDILKGSLHKITGEELSQKAINDQYINNLRNFLKHARPDPRAKESFGMQHEAINAVVRAFGNIALLDELLPVSSSRFFAWFRSEFPELIEEAKNAPL